MKKETLCNQALEYLENGFSIIPVSPDTKEPLLASWSPFTTRHPEKAEVQRWWQKWPYANIAIITGKISGISVIDFDSPDALPKLEAVTGETIPDTFRVGTAKGKHIYLDYCPDLKNIIRLKDHNGQSIDLDIKNDGGYVVAAGSTHETGIQYEWLGDSPSDYDDWREELEPVPQGIVSLALKKNDQVTQEKLDTSSILNGVPEGERDQQLFKYACSLRGRNLSEVEALTLIRYAAANCSPPFPESEALTKFYQAWKYEPNEESKAPVIEIISMAEILELDPQIEPIAEGFLNRGENLIINAAGGVGKSTFAQQMAQDLAAPYSMLGNTLFETFPIRHHECQSLFIQSENSMTTINARARACDPSIASRIFFPKIYDDVLMTGGTFEDPNFIRRVIDIIHAIEDRTDKAVDLGFIDPLISYYSGEENGAGDMRTALDGITQISQETGITPIVLHHDNKQGDYRGSTAINDWCRSRIHLKQVWIGEDRIQDFDSNNKPIVKAASIPAVEIHHEKANNMALFESFTMVLNKRLQFVKVDDPVDPAIKKRSLEVQQALKDLGGFAKSNNILAKAVSELTGRSQRTCKTDISKAVESGYINSQKTKEGATHAYCYSAIE